jgi:hypothetical protein
MEKYEREEEMDSGAAEQTYRKSTDNVYYRLPVDELSE